MLSIKTHMSKIKYKIVLLGDQAVGKTAIINRFINDNFVSTYDATIGIDFLVKNVTYDQRQYRLQLWDTAGQQRFKSLIPSYLKDSNCCLIVYDATNTTSLQNAVGWLQLYNEHKSQKSISFLIANKIDLQQSLREKTNNKAANINKLDKLMHFRVSAKDGTGINQLFRGVASELDTMGKSFMKLSMHTSAVSDRHEKEEFPSSKPLRHQREMKDTHVILTVPEQVQHQVEKSTKKRCCF